jgi:hypothetical protein
MITLRCCSRITYESEKLPFGDGKHYFYTEFQCEHIAEKNLCKKCYIKRDTNIQESRFFDHGLITDNYTEKSHIFDSPWYHKMVKAYGSPNKENLEKAMEKQKKVREGSTTVNESEPKKRTNRKPIVKRKSEEIPIVTELNDKMVETTDEPLDVIEVIQVILRPFTHNGLKYWRDEHREKLYKNINGKKGDYVGRWDLEMIQSIPDSDAE